MSQGNDAATAAAAKAAADADKAVKRREIAARVEASRAKTAMDQKASAEMAKIAKTQLVLVGEHHADDLGECITDIVISTPELITGNIIICREQIEIRSVSFATSRSSKSKQYTIGVRPLETGGETFDYDQRDMWQQHIHECTASRITDAYYLLETITPLLSDGPGSSCGGECARYGNIFANLPDEDRPPFLTLFKTNEDLKKSCKDKDKLQMAKLYQMVYDLLKKLMSSDLDPEKYAQFSFQEKELQIQGKATGVMVMADNTHNIRLGKRLIQQTQMERDVRMVDNLKNIVCELPIGEKQLAAVVVVGDEHFMNMKRLLLRQGFQIIVERRTASVSQPQKHAIVTIRAGTELDGSSGYIMGDRRKEDAMWPVFVSGQPDIIWLNADDFNVEEVEPTIETLHAMFDPLGEPLLSYIGTMQHKKKSSRDPAGHPGGGSIRRYNKKSKKARRQRKSKRGYRHRYRSRKL